MTKSKRNSIPVLKVEEIKTDVIIYGGTQIKNGTIGPVTESPDRGELPTRPRKQVLRNLVVRRFLNKKVDEANKKDDQAKKAKKGEKG